LRLLSLLGTLVSIIATGTVFFRWVEGWSWLDSYFFTVVTLSTVGYGELVPQSAAGRIGTTVFILVGLGIFAVAVQQFGQYAMRKREEHTEWLIARLGHPPHRATGRDKRHAHSVEDTPANEDAPDRPA